MLGRERVSLMVVGGEKECTGEGEECVAYCNWDGVEANDFRGGGACMRPMVWRKVEVSGVSSGNRSLRFMSNCGLGR